MRCESTGYKCKKFDSRYGNRKKLTPFQAHGIWMTNQYHPEDNVDGIVNFGTSVNSVIPKTTIKYLPEFITENDCAYLNPLGSDPQFNSIVCKETNFKHNETFCFNHVCSAISSLCFHYSKVCFIGEYAEKSAIIDHSKAKAANQQDAELIVAIYQNQQKVTAIRKNYSSKAKVFLINSKAQLQYFNELSANQAVCYQYSLKQLLNFGVIQSKDQKILQTLGHSWNFFQISSLLRKASLTANAELKLEYEGTQHIRKMIEIDSKVTVKQENIWITIGATCALDSISRVIFNGGKICLDSPYYVGFDHDFLHCGVQLVSKPMDQKIKLLDRIKQAQTQGCVGYIICNPHNPVGTFVAAQQVASICEWAKQKQKFHLIFDQMYLNTCVDSQTKTAASYAISQQNVHVVRGFAKDFGICGFKIGMAISSSNAVKQKLNRWKNIISHPPYALSVISKMLVNSNHGQDIIKQGKQILKQHFQVIFSILDNAGIQYTKPGSGCFIFADMRKFLRGPSQDEENVLWKKMFYDFRVNLSNGFYFHAPEPGYFRICPITDMQTMKQGLRRVSEAVNDKNQ